MNQDNEIRWLLLIVSLPTPSATARMRVWRGLKALGCMALRDGAYLLPAGEDRESALRELGDDCTREGGVAWLMAVHPLAGDEERAYRQLFDRSEDYAELRKSWKEANRTLSSLSAADLTRLQRKLQREYEAVRAIDFFEAEAGVEAEAAWAELNKRIEQQLSPDEPQETQGGIARLDRERPGR